MPTMRAMFIGHGPSNLPEDRIVNTFHFQNDSLTYGEMVANGALALADFYNGTNAGGPAQAHTIAGYLSPWIQRDCEMRFYNLADTKPRVPDIFPLTLLASDQSSGMAEEVACVITLHGAPPVTPRRRGRLYIGPLIPLALTLSTGTANSTFSTAFCTDLTLAAKRLVDGSAPVLPGPLGWCIESSKPALNYVPIVSGYVDNAVDIQRNRGPESTIRTPFVGAG